MCPIAFCVGTAWGYMEKAQKAVLSTLIPILFFTLAIQTHNFGQA